MGVIAGYKEDKKLAAGAQYDPQGSGYYSRPTPLPSEANNERQFYEQWYKDQGYKLGARPFEFNQGAFSDPNYQKNQAAIQQMLARYGGRGAPTMDIAQSDDARAQQGALLSDLAGQYRGVISGTAPSISDQQIGMARRAGLNQLLALRGSARGGNVGASSRAAMYGATDLNTGLAGQAVMGRLSEVEAARAGLGNVAGAYQGMRGQDIGVAQANLGANLQTQGMNDSMVQYFMSQGLSQDQAQWQAQMQLQQMMASQHQAAQSTARGIGAPAGQPNPAWAIGGALIGGAASAATAGIFRSDRRLKRDIKASPAELRELLGKLKPYRYRYVEGVEKDGPKRIGVMAQDLEKSKAGKTLVIESGQGKAIDATMAVGTLLAAAADLHKRMNKMEARR